MRAAHLRNPSAWPKFGSIAWNRKPVHRMYVRLFACMYSLVCVYIYIYVIYVYICVLYNICVYIYIRDDLKQTPTFTYITSCRISEGNLAVQSELRQLGSTLDQ